MQAACEAGDVFAWLEGGGEGGAGGAGEALGALWGGVREPWLARALLHYHARTGAARALRLLAAAPEPHARHALDALADQLRAEPAARRHALAALAALVQSRPPWLHLLLPPSAVARELVRAARHEREPAPLLNALLALAALLPAQPALAAAHAAELAEAVTRAPPPAASAASRAHLQLGARAVFLAAYATHPCTLLEALRARGAELGGGAAREAWERAVARLAHGVALHPALMASSRRKEADAARWPQDQPHDVLAECARLALPSPPARRPDSPPAGAGEPDAPPECRSSPAPPLVSAALSGSGSGGGMRPGGAGWFPLGERSGAEAAPHTPLPERAEPAPEPEPEPAVEATPENTPARLARQAFRFPPPDSSAARPLLARTPPAAPLTPAPDACSARLARVQAERRAHHSPVPIGGAPPPSAARPQPRHPRPHSPEPEVRELTSQGEAEGAGDAWLGVEPGAPPPARRAFPAPPRARSCPPAGAARAHATVQTVDTGSASPLPLPLPLPEHADHAASSHERATTPKEDSAKFPHNEAVDPTERLDRYLADLYAGRGGAGAGAGAGAGGQAELAEQLALAHAQLMYERWRRDAHAERNRRLLGRCRAVRALELENAALRARVLDLSAERDRLREPRPPSRAARAAPPRAEQEAVAALERELAAERGGRLRAEAALREAEAARARDAAELQRTRGESFEAARHVEALARAALAAERRAEHVRRLRRELLLLAEREARLADAVRGALAGGGGGAGDAGAADGTERALRAACARAEADAEAAGARADALAARAAELEAGAAAREACAAELKRAARAQAEEGAARLRALHDKYRALQHVVRAHAAQQLQRAARDVRTNCG